MFGVKEKIASLLLAGMLCVGTALPVNAAEMATFPYQNRNSFSKSYTKAIQVMMINYNTTTRSHIMKSGGIDSSFGPATAEAVKAFQRAKGLTADGSCGPATWAALRKSLMSNGKEGNYRLYRGPSPYYHHKKNMKQYDSSGGSWYAYNAGGTWSYVG